MTTGGTRQPVGPSTSRAEEILSVAAKLFWAKGYEATSMSNLASALGITKASLYHHIDNKESLLVALSMRSLERINAEVQQAMDAAPDDPLERFRAAVHAHVASALGDRSMHATMLTELRSLPPNHRRKVTRLRDQYDELMEGLIRAAQEAGQIRSDIPARLQRLALLNMLNWTIFWFDPSGDATADSLADLFLEVFLKGALEPDHR
jgi:AcrR family transcriptional regulator